MLKFNRLGLLLAAILTLGFLIAAAPADAAGINVSPKYGNYDTTFDVTATGFNKNETVSKWLGLSNGATVNLGQSKADANGKIEFSVSPQSSWRGGEVIVAVQGLSSKRQYSTKFNIVAPPKESTSTTTTTTTGVSGTTQGEAAVINDWTVRYWGGGYTPGERVAVWFQYPNEAGTSTAHALPDVYADSAGNVAFDFSVQRDWLFGSYHITAEGTKSKHVTFNTFAYFNKVSPPYVYYTSSTVVTNGTWYGEYFNNTDLSGTPALTRYDSAINFNWGTGSPAPQVQADDFSVRWTRTSYYSAGNYTVTATTDDGMRVWIDGNLVINAWYDQPATTYTNTIYIPAGNHTVQVNYYERGLYAVAYVNITPQ